MRLISATHPSGTLSNIAKQRAAMREQNNKNFQKPSSRNLAVSVSKLRDGVPARSLCLHAMGFAHEQ